MTLGVEIHTFPNMLRLYSMFGTELHTEHTHFRSDTAHEVAWALFSLRL